MKKKVVLGMSGGVDSSVAAYILKELGFQVIGVKMEFFDSALDLGCGSNSETKDAKLVAEKLDIPFYTMNFKSEFKSYVMDYFVEEYLAGKTPNPCIVCNRFVKWESLLKKSEELGASYIATGHYARVIFDEERKRYTLLKSETDKKDQTYALYKLTQEQLSKTLMPVGDYSKDEIRNIANKIGLNVANKKDSQEICFIPDNDYVKYITSTGAKTSEGNFIDTNGNVLGKHKGIINYTIGQRKGLGIAFGKPMFVKKINALTNEITLSSNDELNQKEVLIGNINYMLSENLNNETNVLGKIRYSHKASPCSLKMEGNILSCIFDEPQRAITPGQGAVFYKDNKILAGGTIL